MEPVGCHDTGRTCWDPQILPRSEREPLRAVPVAGLGR